MALRGGFVIALLCASCYSPAVEDCAFLCENGSGACPRGFSCEGGFCREPNFQGACPGDLCGNHSIDFGEDCDDNDDDTDACAQCKMARCGDGFVWAGKEVCDDGNDKEDDGCLGCTWARCGDGRIRLGAEQCDSLTDCSGNCVLCKSDTAVNAYAASPSEGGTCFRQTKLEMRTWQLAQDSCATFGSHLATLKDVSEASGLYTKIVMTGETYVGLTQTADQGQLVWVTGQPFNPTGWQPPADDAGERWFVLTASNTLADWDAATTKRFMCEDDGWFVDDATPIVDNHAYKIVYQNVTWAEAKAACEAVVVGGPSHLASIDSTRVDDLLDTKVFLDAWVGGAIDCQLRPVTGALKSEPCDNVHPFICELD